MVWESNASDAWSSSSASLEARPPTRAELGVTIPKGAHLELERTARQLAQHHPQRRVYQYTIEMPQAGLIRFFAEQGLTFDPSGHKVAGCCRIKRFAIWPWPEMSRRSRA